MDTGLKTRRYDNFYTNLDRAKTLNMIHILGAGSMGCLWAAHLSHSNSVCFISRPQHTTHDSKQFALHQPQKSKTSTFNIPIVSIAELPNQQGSTPYHSTQEKASQIQTTSNSLQCLDTLLVCTKSYDALNALTLLKPKLSEQTKIILFQNGLGSQYDILAAFPNNPIFAAVSTEGANRKSDTNVITHAGLGETQLGGLNKPSERFLTICHQTLNTSELIVHLHTDIWQALWTKLIINCAINPFTAILNCPNGQVKQDEYFNQLWPSLKSELANLLKLAHYPSSEAEVEQQVFEVMHKTQHNISSMLQDTRKHKPTEVDHINGFAYRFLKQHSQAHQANKQLWESVNALRN